MKNIVDRKLILKWIRALRSRKYRQTRRTLRRSVATDGTAAGFCCLGVLCDISGVGKWKDDLFVVGKDVVSGHLPPRLYVRESGGEPSHNPVLGYDCATTLNDEGASFRRIATLIEEHVLPNYPQKKKAR